jgi:CBS domain containing-hemolysin-like protein
MRTIPVAAFHLVPQQAAAIAYRAVPSKESRERRNNTAKAQVHRLHPPAIQRIQTPTRTTSPHCVFARQCGIFRPIGPTYARRAYHARVPAKYCRWRAWFSTSCSPIASIRTRTIDACRVRTRHRARSLKHRAQGTVLAHLRYGMVSSASAVRITRQIARS